jgi:hypothetical protein
MKKLIAFFVMIFNWIISLFKKEVTSEKAHKYSSNPIIPKHNNRKRGRGRHVQTTPEGRVIFHGAK